MRVMVHHFIGVAPHISLKGYRIIAAGSQPCPNIDMRKLIIFH